MNTRFLKTTVGAMAILMLAVFAPSSVLASDHVAGDGMPEQAQRALAPAHGGARALEGTWDVQVTIRDCASGAAIRTFPSVGTFMFGGTFLDSTSGIPQSLKTPGQGVWSFLGGHTFRLSFKSFSFDPAGNFTGSSKITHVATMAVSGNEYSSEGIAEIYAPNGLLLFTGCSSTTATRFQ